MARLKYWDERSQTWKYADKAITNINVPEIDLTGYATEEYVNDAIKNINGTVLYLPQELAEDQKAQARTNIGAVSKAYMDEHTSQVQIITWEDDD